jgi:CDP-6-deoxy-D-xylo-4-hexulose-3-dehydrase
MQTSAEIKSEILKLTRQYSMLVHSGQRLYANKADNNWKPGDAIPYAARVFNEDEVESAVSTTLDFWLTLGPEGVAFEKELAAQIGVKSTLLVNSGSSANLIALTTLTSHKIPEKKRIHQGDEVITVAAGFPTTVAPIIQCGAVAVFLDNNPVTGNIISHQLESAYVHGLTKAVMIAHALGNPFDLSAVIDFCQKYDLWLIEDNCDSLGSTYSMPRKRALDFGFRENSPGIPYSESHITRYTGTWGDISTQSFYPPHHLTMGEGGAVNIIKKAALRSYAESFRDWGRDCWCAAGNDDTCNKRFGWQLGELPNGYDHKYIYSHLGYNLKPLDIQAAIGREQLKKLPSFINARKINWEKLRSGLSNLDHVFEFMLPTHATSWSPKGFTWDQSGCYVDISWFGFMLRVRSNAPFKNTDLARYLNTKKIGNRMFFGGNLLRQPVFIQLRKDRPNATRLVGSNGSTLKNVNNSTIMGSFSGADDIMNTALFLGTYPGLSEEMIDYEIDMIQKFVSSK